MSWFRRLCAWWSAKPDPYFEDGWWYTTQNFQYRWAEVQHERSGMKLWVVQFYDYQKGLPDHRIADWTVIYTCHTRALAELYVGKRVIYAEHALKLGG